MLKPRHVSDNDTFIRDECTRNINKYMGPLDVVVDIGAHIGYFTYAAVAKGAKQVFAFEPTPCNFKNLVLNVTDDNLLGKVIPIPLALGGEFTTMPIGRAGRNNGQHGLLLQQRFNGPNVARVIPLRALAQMLPERIDYMKIDIEGAEFLAFDDVDATRDLMARVGYLEMELHVNAAYMEIDEKRFPERFRADPLNSIHALFSDLGFTENADQVKSLRRIMSRNLRGVK